jgi:hypothetical protein
MTTSVASAAGLGSLPPQLHRPHPLHGDEVDWPETNCYVDLFIEVLHALDLDPVAALPFLVACDFDGEQWEFFKYPAADLFTLWGIDVREFNVWRPVAEHIERHLALGRLLTVEVDSYFLPDTHGTAYRTEHQKTTVAPIFIDRRRGVLHYFHNRGLFALDGDDYDGILGSGAPLLAPYCELIVTDHLRRPEPAALRAVADQLVREWLPRRPATNPISRMAAAIEADLPWLEAEPERFAGYAFGTLRQCGAWAGLTAVLADWLERPTLQPATAAFRAISDQAKVCQFKLARRARGRAADLSEQLVPMAQQWEYGIDAFVGTYGA